MELVSYKLKGRLQQCCLLKPIVTLALKYTFAANHVSLWTDKIFGPSKDSETVGHKIRPNEVSLSLSHSHSHWTGGGMQFEICLPRE